MLHDLANDAMLHSAEDREGWRQRKDVKNLLYSRRLLMMMMMVLVVGADASVTQPQCQMTQGRTNSR